MSSLNVWMAAKRYGMKMKYTNGSAALRHDSSDEEKDPSYVLTHSECLTIKNPQNGIWIVDITEEPSLQYPTSKASFKKGMRAALKLEFYRIYECSCLIEFRNINSVRKELHAMAFCKECPCEVEYKTFSDRKFLRIVVNKLDISKKHSQNKLKVSGKLKTKILKMLESEKPGIVQSKLADELMNNFSSQHPLVPNKRTLRQIKYRESEKRRTFRDKNPVVSICMMKKEPKYYKCIEDVVHFFSPSVHFLYIIRHRYKKLSLSPNREQIPQKFQLMPPDVVASYQKKLKCQKKQGKKNDVFSIT